MPEPRSQRIRAGRRCPPGRPASRTTATTCRGSAGTLVLVRDSYPSLGWNAHYLQPTDALAAALTRGDGREGGVLAVVSPSVADAVRAVAEELSLETELWDNGT